MQRRELLFTAATAGLVGCASTEGLTERVKLKSIAMLDIKEEVALQDIGPFELGLVGSTGRPSSPPPYHLGVLGILLHSAIDSAAQNRARSISSNRSSIATALQPLQLAPKTVFTRSLLAEFNRLNVPVTTVSPQPGFYAAREDWNFTQFPKEHDAMLDIRIDAAGYFDTKTAAGFSPALYVRVSLVSTIGKGSWLARQSYQADYRPASNDKRFFTTPAHLNVLSLEEFSQRSEELRPALEGVISSMAVAMVEDLRPALTGA